MATAIQSLVRDFYIVPVINIKLSEFKIIRNSRPIIKCAISVPEIYSSYLCQIILGFY